MCDEEPRYQGKVIIPGAFKVLSPVYMRESAEEPDLGIAMKHSRSDREELTEYEAMRTCKAISYFERWIPRPCVWQNHTDACATN